MIPAQSPEGSWRWIIHFSARCTASCLNGTSPADSHSLKNESAAMKNFDNMLPSSGRAKRALDRLSAYSSSTATPRSVPNSGFWSRTTMNGTVLDRAQLDISYMLNGNQLGKSMNQAGRVGVPAQS